MSYEQEFMKEFEAWVNTQIMINDMAHKESQKVYEEDQDERAKDAMIRLSEQGFFIERILSCQRNSNVKNNCEIAFVAQVHFQVQ